MYCSACGNTLTQNLNFCQNCGARSKGEASDSQGPLGMFIASAGAIGVVGLIAFFPILNVLLNNQVHPALFAVVIFAYLLTLLTLFSVMVGNAKKLAGIGGHSSKNKDLEDRSPVSFRGPITSQLEPHQPSSVTDHTTRTLEEVPVRRN
jgi:hypothetical protein